MFTARHVSIVFILILTLLESFVYAEPPNEKEIYRKAISDKEELVITQGPFIPATLLRRFLSAGVAKRTTGAFLLNVDVQSAGKPALRLSSKLSLLGNGWGYDDYDVLDLVVLPGRVVIAISHNKSFIEIDEVGIGQPDRTTILHDDWSPIQAAVPPPGTKLSAQLSETGEGIEVEVVETVGETKQKTVYRQQGEEWKFLRVKQTPERGPNKKSGPESEIR